ncbi:hypothetical protein SORBI_3008G137700 [Sorghum bicolor]|uniref:Factor of DNA methylation 1-5/IDN2 domain-containing protein n=1 Tax=Sorghum bicolor TaxID=4558 RepID=A0A1Z5R6L3_SORBI|nr:hypothetical protein SORBI_3008G137700 [Sorghum bicolor]
MAEDTGMSGLLGALATKVDLKLSLLKDVMAEYTEIKRVINGLAEEKVRLQQEKERLQHEKEMLQHEEQSNGETLAAMKEDLLASKDTLVAARDALVASAEEISQKNSCLEFLKKKLQESEAKNNQAEQLCGSAMDTMYIQPRGVQTRSMQKRKILSEGPLDYGADENEHTSHLDGPSRSPLELLANLSAPTGSMEKQKGLSERPLGSGADNLEVTEERPRQELVNNPPAKEASCVFVSKGDDLEAVRGELIKGFLEIDTGGRIIGIKEMGELDEKAFEAACLAKVPPEEVGAASSQLYASWKQQLGDLSWYPFKAITIDGNHQEIVNIDDDKLQELKRAWGSCAYNAVVNALVEMKEYGRLNDRSIAYELWNFKEGRRATTRECVDYLSTQVKRLTVTKRRKTRRSV